MADSFYFSYNENDYFNGKTFIGISRVYFDSNYDDVFVDFTNNDNFVNDYFKLFAFSSYFSERAVASAS